MSKSRHLLYEQDVGGELRKKFRHTPVSLDGGRASCDLCATGFDLSVWSVYH